MAIELNPDYDPDSWRLSYQQSQFGVVGDDVARAAEALSAMANPPAAMVTAATSTPGVPPYNPAE